MEGLMAIGILALIAGFVLLGVEMTIPGFGVPGIFGAQENFTSGQRRAPTRTKLQNSDSSK